MSLLEKLWTLDQALIYFILFGVLTGIQANLTKALASTFQASFLTFVRCVPSVIALPFVEWDDANTHCTLRDLLLYIAVSAILVTTFGATNISFMFLGAGDSNAIEFGGGLIITAVVGHFVLKEKISFLYFWLLLVNCTGIVMVSKPQLLFGDSQVAATSREVGVIIALSGACFGAAWTILVRQVAIRNALYCFTLTVITGLVGMALTGLWCTLDAGWRIPTTWLNVCLFAFYVVSSGMQCVFAIKVVQYATAKEVAVAMTISVVISYILQVTIFGEEVDTVRISGAVLIIVCVFVSAVWMQLGTVWQECFHARDIVSSSNDDREVVSLVAHGDDNCMPQMDQ